MLSSETAAVTLKGTNIRKVPKFDPIIKVFIVQ